MTGEFVAAVTIGGVVAIKLPEPVPVQELLSVTVTEYVPATNPFREVVVDMVDHKYEYGELPPRILADAVPSLPAHVTLVVFTVTVGFVCTVTFTAAEVA